jgi:mycothiol synthase
MSEMLRVPNENDAKKVARLLSEGSPEPIGPDSVLRDWSFPGVQIELDARLAPGSYAFVDGFGDGRVWIDLAGQPTAELFDWAELRARELGSRFLSGGWLTQGSRLRELERRGFVLVRTSYRMAIDLGEPTPEPVWPAGVEARAFAPGDEEVFYDLHQESFRDTWEPIEETYDEWAHQFLEPEVLVPALWTLAFVGVEPVGFAMCHPHAVDSGLGWVRVLGVRGRFRGRGLGRALLLHAFTQFRDQGLVRAGLGVDSESPTGANKLYESVGMRISAQFAIHEKSAR